jgi:hypothetical protein
VVLDGIPTTALAAVPSGITLVTPTGRTVAHVPIQIPRPPVIANCGNLLPPPVYIAAGGVYWSDEKGVIRRLETDGRTSNVASFDLQPGQQIRFAVSPDGGRIVASMLTVPPITGGLDAGLRDPDSRWLNRTLLAVPGEAPRVVAEVAYQTRDVNIPKPTQVIGWDAQGPLATLDTELCAQSVSLGRLEASALIHLGLDGTHLDQVGGAGCRPLDYVPNGPVLCLDSANPPLNFSVRTAAGAGIWGGPATTCHGRAQISPDGERVLGISCVQTRDPAGGPPGVQPSPTELISSPLLVGWYTSIIAVSGPNGVPGNLKLVSALDPSSTSDLGLTGYYLGTLSVQ